MNQNSKLQSSIKHTTYHARSNNRKTLQHKNQSSYNLSLYIFQFIYEGQLNLLQQTNPPHPSIHTYPFHRQFTVPRPGCGTLKYNFRKLMIYRASRWRWWQRRVGNDQRRWGKWAKASHHVLPIIPYWLLLLLRLLRFLGVFGDFPLPLTRISPSGMIRNTYAIRVGLRSLYSIYCIWRISSNRISLAGQMVGDKIDFYRVLIICPFARSYSNKLYKVYRK